MLEKIILNIHYRNQKMQDPKMYVNAGFVLYTPTAVLQ